jgi:hypothetical protein
MSSTYSITIQPCETRERYAVYSVRGYSVTSQQPLEKTPEHTQKIQSILSSYSWFLIKQYAANFHKKNFEALPKEKWTEDLYMEAKKELDKAEKEWSDTKTKFQITHISYTDIVPSDDQDE